MGAGDRLLLFVVSVLLFIASITAILVGFGFDGIAAVSDFWGKRIPYRSWEVILVSLVLIAAALRLMRLSIPKRKPHEALIASSDMGNVAITLPAIENLVRRSAVQIDGVHEVKPKIEIRAGSVTIKVQAWVRKGSNVPELATGIQEAVKVQLKETAGLDVAVINVQIQDMDPGSGLGSRRSR